MAEVSETGRSKYKKTSGFADVAGQFYEFKLAALLFLKALNRGVDFSIASNMEAAGSFDDVVFRINDRAVFLQLKHKENPKRKVKMSHLLNTSTNGDFNLLKYCKSYLEIKKQWEENGDLQQYGKFENTLFVVYTNTSIVERTGVSIYNNELLNIINSGGKCVRFSEDKDKEIFDIFKNLQKYKEILSKALSSEDENVVNESSNIVPVTDELHEVMRKLEITCNSKYNKKELKKSLDNLNSLGDLSDYKDFFSQLYFLTEQAAEYHMNNLIEQEMFSLCGTHSVFDQFCQGVQDWWRHSNIFLTSSVQFWQDITQSLFMRITNEKVQQLLNLRIQFVHNTYNTIEKTCSSTCQILYIKSDGPILSCLKACQSLGTQFVIDVKILMTDLNVVLSLWRLGIYGDILIVEGGIQNQDVMTRLLKVLRSNPRKKVVIVAPSKHTLIEELVKQFEYKTTIDSFSLNQLDKQSQEYILSQEVMFQDSTLHLHSFSDISVLQNIVTADMVIQMLLSHKTIEIGCMLNIADDCYISRKFVRMEIVKAEILCEKEIGKIAVSGLDVEDLKSLVPSDELVLKFDTNTIPEQSNCYCFTINDINDYIELCKVYKTVHWIHRYGDYFRWRHTKGDISLIKRFLQQDKQSYNNIQEILQVSHQMILLVAQPGMGKSTELSHLSSLLKQKNKKTWVVRVDLNNHADYLNQDCPNAFELLIKAGKFNSTFQKHLLSCQVYETGNIIVMFDGYDEISPKYSDKVDNMLHNLSNTKIRHILVTTRPVFRERLETTLCTLPYFLKHFTEEEQASFLYKFWNAPTNGSDNFSTFSDELLKLTAKSLNDNLKKFTGIPLQTKMIAEIFHDGAKEYINTGEIKLPIRLDILYLYHRFVSKKWEVYCKKNEVKREKVGVSEDYEHLEYIFQQSHMNCALIALLKHSAVRKLRNYRSILRSHNKFVDKFKTGQNKTGIIIDITNDKVVFVHRTFAEYFVAKWFSNHLLSMDDNNNNNNNRKHFYKTMRSTFVVDKKNVTSIFRDDIYFNFQVTRIFFNMFLAEKSDLHMAVLKQDKTGVQSLLAEQNVQINKIDCGGRTALYLSVMNFLDTYNDSKLMNSAKEIMSLLMENKADPMIKDKILNWRPLQLAIYSRAWCAVELLMNMKVKSKDLALIQHTIKNEAHLEILLRTAAEEGLVNLMNCVLQNGVCTEFPISTKYCEKCTMLHIASQYGQQNLVTYLLNSGVNYNSQNCKLKRTPLMWAVENGHLEVAEILLNKEGISVTATDITGNTAMHLALKQYFMKCYSQELKTYKESLQQHTEWKIIQMLLQSGADASCSDKNGDTVLHIAAMHGNEERFKALLRLKANFNIKNKYGETPMMAAAKSRRWVVVNLLLQHGADMMVHDENNDTVLHIAARYDSEICIKLLWDMKIDLNITNRFKETPLLIAAKSRHWNIVMLLLRLGANIMDSDEFGSNVLHLAAKNNNEETVIMITDMKINLNVRNKCHETPILVAALSKNWNIVRILLEHGADVNDTLKNGDTLLHLACKYNDEEAVDLLLDMEIDVNIKNEIQETPIAKAAMHKNWSIVALLLKKGVDTLTYTKEKVLVFHFIARNGNDECIALLYNCNVLDNNNNTVLHIAARYGNQSGVKTLLDMNADLNVHNKKQETPLLIAIKKKQWEVVQLLLQHGADVRTYGEDGNTALHYAAMHDNNKCAAMLIDAGVMLDIRNKFEQTPLILAVHSCKWNIVKLLLQRGADMTCCDKNGNTVLHIAAGFGSHETVQMLLDMGANTEIKNYIEETPLMRSGSYCEWEIAKLLIQHGSDVNTYNSDKNTILHLASANGKEDCVKLLLDRNVDIYAINALQETPIVTAINHANWSVVKLFLQHGVNTTAYSKKLNDIIIKGQALWLFAFLNSGLNIECRIGIGVTPLWIAAYHGQLNVIVLLCVKGADLHSRYPVMSCTMGGYTPLHAAVVSGNEEVVAFLLRKGARLTKCDNKGQTPLHVAAARGALDIVSCLLSYGADLMALDNRGQTALECARASEKDPKNSKIITNISSVISFLEKYNPKTNNVDK